MTNRLARRPGAITMAVAVAVAVATIMLAACANSATTTATASGPVSTVALPTVATTTTAATSTSTTTSASTATSRPTPPPPTTVDAVVTTAAGGAPVTLPPFNDRNGNPLDPPPVVVPAGTIPLAPLPVTAVPNPNVQPMPANRLPAVDVHVKFVTAYLDAISHYPVDTGRDRYAGLATDTAIDQTIAYISERFESRHWYSDLTGGITLRPSAFVEDRTTSFHIGDCWWQSLRIVDGSTGREITKPSDPKYKADGLGTAVTLTNGSWIVTDVEILGDSCSGVNT